MKRLMTIGCMLLFGFSSCSKFLEEKPESSLALPHTLQDFKAILNNEAIYNAQVPDVGDIASDFYFLNDQDWASRPEKVRNNYLWKSEEIPETNWTSYDKVFYANFVINNVDNALRGHMQEEDRELIKGEAYFLRGFIFYHLAQVFAPPFEKENAASKLGIPIRLSEDINVITVRASLLETYSQIISDLNNAISRLPEITRLKVRPSKAAAYAAMSRVYLAMEDYKNAGLYADSCLAIQHELMDYNDKPRNSTTNVFPVLNEEVIFHTQTNATSAVLHTSRARVDTLLFEKYSEHDLRKELFYKNLNMNNYTFIGIYDGGSSYIVFGGLATDEMYLTSAECKVRMGNLTEGLDLLDKLLIKRYVNGKYIPFRTNDEYLALKRVLDEREKELAFRGGIRWTDLRRLNMDERFARTLYRKINGEVYMLEPNSERYTFKIPEVAIRQSGIEQNP